MQPDLAIPRVIALEQNGQHVFLTDEQSALLGVIAVPRIRARADADHGYELQPQQESLLYSPEGQRIANAGCLPLLGYVAHVSGFRINRRMAVSITELPELETRDDLHYPQLADFVRAHERGVIRVPDQMDEVIPVAELADAFPARQIIVIGPTVAKLKQMERKLCEAQHRVGIPEAQHRANPVHYSREQLTLDVEEDMPRLVLSTPLGVGDLDFATCDLVILTDAKHCVHERVQIALQQIDAQFRLFGITRASDRLSPYEAGKVMGVLGPEVIELMPNGRTRRNVHVAWIRHNQPQNLEQRETSAFDFKCLWHNETRNRAIAKLAKALARGEALDEEQHQSVVVWFEGRNYMPQAVTVLVDRLVHAVALAKKLPDWPIIAGEDLDLVGLPRSIKTRLKRGRQLWIDGPRQIVLTDSAASVAGNCSDVVIWAGGGPHGPEMPDSWFGQERDTEHPLLVVDFLDLFNAQTRQWQHRRRERYDQQDIFEVGVDPLIGRIERFLHRHWRGGRQCS